MLYTKATFASALAAIPVALAQTFTDCNPTEKSCSNNAGFLGSSFKSDFTTGSGDNSSWSTAAYTNIAYGDNGAEFTIAKAGQAPTLQTDFYIFFGKVEVVMQAAPGQGIVSSIVLESDDLDEIDWEFLGGDITQVQTNYYGKGNTTTYDRAIYYPIASPQTIFHTYTIDWTSDYIKFSVDGTLLRTLNYKDANGGTNFPQTPMRLKLGNWAGGAAGNAAGTIEWAGGATDFTKAPFTMYVKSVSVTNYNPATEYEWTDRTGSWQSIKLIKGDGSSASAGSSSGTTTAKSTFKTLASTSFQSIKKLQQTDAAVSSTSKSAAASITGSSVSSSHSANSSSTHTGTTHSTTLNSTLTSSTKNSSAQTTSTSSGSSALKSVLAMSTTQTTSRASQSGSSTASSTVARQTTNAASSNSVTTAMVVLGSIAFAFVTL